MTSERGGLRWNRVIPHYDLTPELLPQPGAGWDELVYFAGTWDGYVVLPGPGALEQFVHAGRERFVSDGALPEGLTLLRTALHGEQRADYWGEGEGPSTEELRYITRSSSASASSCSAARIPARRREPWAASRTRS